ncbi:hypothetical protein [Paenibacillus sp. FSL K6-2524]|uniref:hypothetical protein n=1 Tax=Paenibacillus sp. FSL K6-2524 TaxID=2954516 RepID=UPI0030FB92A3
MSTHVSVVIINNKANVVVSPSVEIHTDAVVKLKRQGGKELTHEIIGHELNNVIIQEGVIANARQV